jgi:hypothetical protein
LFLNYQVLNNPTEPCQGYQKSCRAQKLYPDNRIGDNAMPQTVINKNNLRDFWMFRCLAYAFTAIFKAKARLIAENLCLRQQLVVLKRRQARPLLRDADRRFWIFACQLFSGWYRSLIIVRPDTVVSWHHKGWKAYWRWRSQRLTIGRRRIELELRELIRRIAHENPLWGQRRIQAELARLGFEVCARTVARYMRLPYIGTPSPGWRQFLAQHSDEIWASAEVNSEFDHVRHTP